MHAKVEVLLNTRMMQREVSGTLLTSKTGIRSLFDPVTQFVTHPHPGMFDAPSQRPAVNERREGSLAELWRREPGWRLGVALLLLQNIRDGAMAAHH